MDVKNLIIKLLNIIESQAQLIEEQQNEIQSLKDEISRLKGEKGKPKSSPNARKESNDFSSPSTEKRKKWSKSAKKPRIKYIVPKQKSYKTENPFSMWGWINARKLHPLCKGIEI